MPKLRYDLLFKYLAATLSGKPQPGFPYPGGSIAISAGISSASSRSALHHRYRIRPVTLSITHKFSSQHGTQRDIGEA